MLAVLYEPLPVGRALLLTCAVIVAVTLYCLAYTALSGTAESLFEGVLWTTVNIVPFLFAFEGLKRVAPLAGQAAILLVAIVVSVASDALAFGSSGAVFEIVLRLPSAILALLAARTGALIAARRLRRPAEVHAHELPLAPAEIDWVAAAGNYVEIHGGRRTVLHRAPLAAVETLLAPHGFVRIHRSRLVARRAVARMRAIDIILHDGVSLKTGARYRADLRKTFG